MGWLWAVMGSALIVALAAAPPWLPPGLRAAVMHGFDIVCHQIPDRSAHVHGVPFALCDRCMGIGVGLLIGVIALPALPSRIYVVWAGLSPLGRVFAACLPAAADWVLGASGIWVNTPLSRSVTGILLGVTLGSVLAEAVSSTEARSSATTPETTLSP